jgi:dihydroneopterin aldolase
MTLMLSSVTGPEEAEIAISGGADIIDLKDPAAGALAALSIGRIRGTVAAVAGRRVMSAVAGVADERAPEVAALVRKIAATGVDYVKVGLATGSDREALLRAMAGESAAAVSVPPPYPSPSRGEGSARLVAVLFADQESECEKLLPAIANAGFAGVMLDTAEKSTGGLLARAPIERLPSFVEAARARKLLVGFAGGLKAVDVLKLLPLRPDFLGFRGALCEGDRRAAIDVGRVRAIRHLIPREGRMRLQGSVAGGMRRARVG